MKKKDGTEEFKLKQEYIPADDPEIHESASMQRLKAMQKAGKEENDDAEEKSAEGTKTVSSWFSNYWYHYKWRTLIILLVIVVLVAGVAQLIAGSDVALKVLYVGPNPLVPSETKAIQIAFEDMLNEEVQGEKSDISFYDLTYLTNDQIDERVAEASEQGVDVSYDKGYLNDNYVKWQNELATGNDAIFLIDPVLYDEIKDRGILLPLNEIFDVVPDCAIDEYGIELSQTDFYSSYEYMDSLPEDIILCVRDPDGMLTLKTDKKKKETKAAAETIINNIVSYEESEETSNVNID